MSEETDQKDASRGGCGAPPEPDRPNRAPVGLTREYASEAIRVQWYAERCIHAGECIRTAPGVFDPRRRPWIDLSGADADRVARAVERCPTGALHYVRLDGGPQETPPEQVEIRTTPGGPLYVHGAVTVVTPEGEVVDAGPRVALCRCGRSRHGPFCDNTHRTLGDWESTPPPA
jgi:uncharacterized Fe-S cluster protein YjdI/CDGSH-type Zn-finger protein